MGMGYRTHKGRMWHGLLDTIGHMKAGYLGMTYITVDPHLKGELHGRNSV